MTMNQLFQNLQENLKDGCCGKFNLTILSPKARHIKLYNRIVDACAENNNYRWYLIEEIYQLNTPDARPSKIVCHKCAKNGKCIISMRINSRQNTRFCVIGNIQLSDAG